jgi:hypothetical protein
MKLFIPYRSTWLAMRLDFLIPITFLPQPHETISLRFPNSDYPVPFLSTIFEFILFSCVFVGTSHS